MRRRVSRSPRPARRALPAAPCPGSLPGDRARAGPSGNNGSVMMGALLAQNPQLFLGKDLLAWLVLAFGAALVVGNVAALVRPPDHLGGGAKPRSKGGAVRSKGGAGASGPRPDRPPLGRSIVMIVVGLVAALWGLASLVGG